MNVLSEMTAEANQNSDVETQRVTLGQGNDLDPRFLRWCISGGVGGFLVWAITSIPAMPLHELLHQRGPTQIITLMMSGMLSAFLVSKWRRITKQEKGCSSLELDIVNLNEKDDVSAAANDYLRTLGYVSIAYSWIKVLEVSFKDYNENKNFYDDKINTAKFYFDKVLPRAEQHYKTAISGSSNIMNFKFN